MNRILTIAIPTYNRPNEVKRQVELLLPQLTAETELLVIDNNSAIKVDSLFTEEQLQQFTLIRNKVNIGADANIAKCYEYCNTDWLITLGDDDPVEPFAVETIIQDIKNCPPNTVFINYDPKSKYIAKGLKDFAAHTLNRYWCLFWMSGCVYNLGLLNEYMHLYHYSISTMQPGIILLVNALANHPEYKVWVTGKGIHSNAGADIQWNRESFIIASLFVFDILRDYRSLLNGTLFKSITGLLYRHVITMSKYEKNLKHSIRLISTISSRRGLVKTIEWDFDWYIRAIYHALRRK